MSALRDYRKAAKITLDDMAPKLGVSVGSLSRIERGEQWPDREFFERLQVVTEGKVTADDMISNPAPSPEQGAAA